MNNTNELLLSLSIITLILLPIAVALIIAKYNDLMLYMDAAMYYHQQVEDHYNDVYEYNRSLIEETCM